MEISELVYSFSAVDKTAQGLRIEPNVMGRVQFKNARCNRPMCSSIAFRVRCCAEPCQRLDEGEIKCIILYCRQLRQPKPRARVVAGEPPHLRAGDTTAGKSNMHMCDFGGFILILMGHFLCDVN
jgi:hypothetical protein